MYVVSGGYVDNNDYTEGGQKIVYHISPHGKTWRIEKSSAFLLEGRYGHSMATAKVQGKEKVFVIGG